MYGKEKETAAPAMPTAAGPSKLGQYAFSLCQKSDMPLHDVALHQRACPYDPRNDDNERFQQKRWKQGLPDPEPRDSRKTSIVSGDTPIREGSVTSPVDNENGQPRIAVIFRGQGKRIS